MQLRRGSVSSERSRAAARRPHDAMAGARAQSHGLIDNFFLTDEELDNSPSRRAGVDADTERRLRAFGCELIQLGVLHMKAPQAVAATGQVLLQRFYCKESLLKYDVKARALALLSFCVCLSDNPQVTVTSTCPFQSADAAIVWQAAQWRSRWLW